MGSNSEPLRACPGCLRCLPLTTDCPACGPADAGIEPARPNTGDSSRRASRFRRRRGAILAVVTIGAAAIGVSAVRDWHPSASDVAASAAPGPNTQAFPALATEVSAPPGPAVSDPLTTTSIVLGPQLPEPTGTTLLIADDGDTQLLAFELDTGTVTIVDLRVPPTGLSPSTVISVAGGIIDIHGPTIRFVPIDGSPPVDLAPNRCGALAADQLDQVWIVDCEPRISVRAVDLDGRPLTDAIVLPANSYPIGGWSDGVVVQGVGQISRVDAAGAVTPIADGLSSGVAGGRLLRTSCRNGDGCRADIVDIITGVTVASLARPTLEPQSTGYFGRTSAAVSPDRSQLVVASGFGPDSSPTFTAIDMRNGTGARVPGASIDLYRDGVAWSDDGRWLFYRGPDSILSAWRIGDPEPIRLTDAPRGPVLASAPTPGVKATR